VLSFYFTNYEVLTAISNIMKTDMISKFYNLDAHMLLSEDNIFIALQAMQTRSIAMRILSVRLSNAYIVTKRKKDLSRFLYYTKEHLA